MKYYYVKSQRVQYIVDENNFIIYDLGNVMYKKIFAYKLKNTKIHDPTTFIYVELYNFENKLGEGLNLEFEYLYKHYPELGY